LDSFTNPTSSDNLDSVTVPHATQHANANDAIKNIQAELGTNPKGGSATVKARLDAVDTSLSAKAPIASPTFTGTVTIPAGASISGFAPLASPTFTGTVTIPSGASIAGYSALATQQPTYRNAIINGAFAVDQRNKGASQTFTAGAALAYSVDRFYGYCTGANVTGQRVATGASPYFYAYQFTGAASNTAVGFGTRLTQLDTYHFAGQTATLSAVLSSNALTSVTWTAYYANTADTFGTLASPTRTQIATGTFTITSTATRYSTQISIPSAATTGIEIVFSTGALVATQTLTISAVQLELGSIATPFENRSVSLETHRCQRYYFRAFPGATTKAITNGQANTTTTFTAQLPFPVTMRAVPSAIEQTGTAANYSFTNTAGTATALSAVPTYSALTTDSIGIFTGTVAAGLTAGSGGLFSTANAAAYIGFSAEL
jgi:hypothetical protein